MKHKTYLRKCEILNRWIIQVELYPKLTGQNLTKPSPKKKVDILSLYWKWNGKPLKIKLQYFFYLTKTIFLIRYYLTLWFGKKYLIFPLKHFWESEFWNGIWDIQYKNLSHKTIIIIFTITLWEGLVFKPTMELI